MNAKFETVQLEGVFFGQVQHRWEGRPPSAIGKSAVDGRRKIDEFGFTDDAQADLDNHGGHNKAIHHYATDHYSTWIAEGEIPTGTIPAAFGENISSHGMTEDQLCIGDIIKLGSATVQISQGRQPCWKVSEYTNNKRMAYKFQKTGRTGWYYRVLEGGEAGVGDAISVIERPQPEWSVKRVSLARLSCQVTRGEAELLAVMSELASGWRYAFAKMAAGDLNEDQSKRLEG
jgi:MOSC domain-containing protein YiiM